MIPPPLIEEAPAPGEPGSIKPESYIAPRNFSGWISLALIFALLLALNFADIHATKMNKEPSARPYAEQELAIRGVMSAHNLMDEAKTLNPEIAKPDKNELEDTEKKLSEKAAADPAAARLLVVAKGEQAERISDEDLANATRQNTNPTTAFATIYQSKKLSTERANSLASQLPDTEWAYKAAKAHAFELAGDKSYKKELAPAWKAVLLIFFFMLILAGCVAGVIVWILYYNRRQMGLSVPLGHPATPMSPAEADRFAIRASWLMVAFVVGQIIGGGAFLHSSKAAMLAAITGLSLMGVLAVCTLPVGGMHISFRRIGIRADQIGKDILWGLIGYAALIPILVITFVIGFQLMKIFGQSTHPVTELLESSPNFYLVAAIFFAASIGAPIMEEIIFRGTLFPAFGTITKSPVWGIVISSFLFAALHPQGVPLWLGLGSVGAMNCMLAYQRRSLIPSMVLHFTHNTLLVVIGLLIS